MLHRRNRFHGRGSLRYVHRAGQTSRNRHLLLRFVPNLKRRHSRVAVVVGKKVAKSAVTRNRIRRRIFEIIRLHLPEIPTGHDLVVTVYSRELATLPAAEVERHVLNVLSGAHLLSKKPPTSVTID
ncbi:MAG TPA: ribonuclease P protein component [Candidatus Saccharimonadales bacterium]|jgi:ribonuclease P protein component